MDRGADLEMWSFAVDDEGCIIRKPDGAPWLGTQVRSSQAERERCGWTGEGSAWEGA